MHFHSLNYKTNRCHLNTETTHILFTYKLFWHVGKHNWCDTRARKQSLHRPMLEMRHLHFVQASASFKVCRRWTKPHKYLDITVRDRREAFTCTNGIRKDLFMTKFWRQTSWLFHHVSPGSLGLTEPWWVSAECHGCDFWYLFNTFAFSVIKGEPMHLWL